MTATDYQKQLAAKKGLTLSQYQQQVRANNPRKCEVPGCDKPHYAKGQCWTHYRKSVRKAEKK